MNTQNIFMFRLKPQDDLKLSLLKIIQEKQIQTGAILSAVGSFSKMRVRIADGKTILENQEYRELISMSGTLSDGHVHIHLSAINTNMEVFGGHLEEGCVIHTTMELVIADYSTLYHSQRRLDESTGYKELELKRIDK